MHVLDYIKASDDCFLCSLHLFQQNKVMLDLKTKPKTTTFHSLQKHSFSNEIILQSLYKKVGQKDINVNRDVFLQPQSYLTRPEPTNLNYFVNIHTCTHTISTIYSTRLIGVDICYDNLMKHSGFEIYGQNDYRLIVLFKAEYAKTSNII